MTKKTKLNPNPNVVAKIKLALIRNEGYCPCVSERNDDTICQCKKYRETGECCCNLYVVDEE